jgi:antitoxin component of RelBE/YafQ-DinJ toxin-antitoxin module
MSTVKTTILIKTEKKVKEAAQRNLKRAGIPLSTYLNMQLRKVARTPELEIELVPSPLLARWIREAEKEYEAGTTPGPFKDAAGALAKLKRA